MIRRIIERVRLIVWAARYRDEQRSPDIQVKSLAEREHDLWREFTHELEDELNVERGTFDEVPTPPERDAGKRFDGSSKRAYDDIE